MKNIHSAEALYEEMAKLEKDNSITQFSVPGKGDYTLIYDDSHHEKTIQEEVDEDEELKKMIHESRKDYKESF